jgi:hypothetical protein
LLYKHAVLSSFQHSHGLLLVQDVIEVMRAGLYDKFQLLDDLLQPGGMVDYRQQASAGSRGGKGRGGKAADAENLLTRMRKVGRGHDAAEGGHTSCPCCWHPLPDR